MPRQRNLNQREKSQIEISIGTGHASMQAKDPKMHMGEIFHMCATRCTKHTGQSITMTEKG